MLILLFYTAIHYIYSLRCGFNFTLLYSHLLRFIFLPLHQTPILFCTTTSFTNKQYYNRNSFCVRAAFIKTPYLCLYIILTPIPYSMCFRKRRICEEKQSKSVFSTLWRAIIFFIYRLFSSHISRKEFFCLRKI